MTRDEALDRLEAVVMDTVGGHFDNLEQAFGVAASALNYIMDNVEGEDDKG